MRPAFCLTFLPGVSTVPFALLVMVLVFRFSTTTMWGRVRQHGCAGGRRVRGPYCRPCSHWSIENPLLDMAFREDASRIRTGDAAHNMSILRRRILNLLRRETTAKGTSPAARRKQAGWNDGYLLKVLSNWNAIALKRRGRSGMGLPVLC